MKRLYLLFFLLLSALTLYFLKDPLLASAFDVSGEIGMPEHISKNYFKPNNMLFIIVKNEKDVPVAVKEVINPIFPLKFTLTKKDIILQGLITARIKIGCVLNRSGNVGKMSPGDVYSSAPVKTFLFSKNIFLTLDSVYK